jgi:hypothetical protein
VAFLGEVALVALSWVFLGARVTGAVLVCFSFWQVLA